MYIHYIMYNAVCFFLNLQDSASFGWGKTNSQELMLSFCQIELQFSGTAYALVHNVTWCFSAHLSIPKKHVKKLGILGNVAGFGPCQTASFHWTYDDICNNVYYIHANISTHTYIYYPGAN